MASSAAAAPPLLPPPAAPPSYKDLHFLLLPVPGLGHITPMLSFASRLAALSSCTVTFVRAEKPPLASSRPQPHVAVQDQPHAQKLADSPLAEETRSWAVQATAVVPSDAEASCLNGMHNSLINGTSPVLVTDPAFADLGPQQVATVMSQNPSETDCAPVRPSHGESLQFWTLPYSGRPSSLTAASHRFEILQEMLADLEDRQELVGKFVQDSKSTDAPIACIICDILLWSWVKELARKHGILAAVLVSGAGTNFYVRYLSMTGKSDESKELHRRLGLAEMKPPTNPELMKRIEGAKKFFVKMHDGIEEASHVLVNSIGQLESVLVESLSASKLKVKFIGPCLSAWNVGSSEPENAMATEAGRLFTPDHACLPWLEGQEMGSVLFISFGSEASLEEGQVQELAAGIEQSGCKFLWVVRPDMPPHNLPREDFRWRTHDRGVFVPWAPQTMVLRHGAVGGFLTHCGWNSTLESMMCGVPMLCFPLFGDQFFNAQLVVAHWKVGLHLRPSELAMVERGEVERAVRDLMSNDDIHGRVVQLKEVAYRASSDAQTSAESFVQDIAQKVSDSHALLQ